MGSPNLVPIPSPDDKIGVIRALRKLASLMLNQDASPTFASLTLAGALTAAGLATGYIDFDLTPTVSGQEGRMYWNEDDGTVNIGMPGGNVNLQVGQEMIVRCKNTSGAQIGNGKVVRINGATGAFPTIELADADDVSTGVTGLATEDIDNNAFGYITAFGMVRDIDTNAYAAGTFLFLSDTAGEFTNAPPTNGKRSAFVGTVIIQGTSNGAVLVQPVSSPFLNGLSGVIVGGEADQDVLQYNSANGNWENTTRLNDIWDIANGTFLESIDFLVTENAGTVTGSLEQTGGGELTQRFSGGYFNLDTDPALTVDLTAYVGTDAIPKVVYVYILQSDKGTIVASNAGWPAAEHIKIADLIMQSAVTTGAEGVMGNRNHNDHTQDTDGHGHLSHISERLRKEACHWDSGIAISIKDAAGAELSTGNSSTAIELVTAVGVAYQLHDQTFAATDMYVNADDDVHVTNQPVADGGGFFATHDLVSDIVSIQDGTAIGVNKYFNLVVWGVQNKTGTASHIMVNLPSSQYNVEALAVSDADGTTIYDIPFAFKGTGFLIARLTFRLIGGSQWEYVALEDLRGQGPSITAGVSVSTTDHSILNNLTADDHTHYHNDARAVTWLAANHETTYNHGNYDTAYSHSQLASGNPHSVTPAELSLVIGTDVQAWDAGLDSVAGLTYVSPSFVKMTGATTFALRTIAETADDLEAAIDHNNLANTHNLTTDIDHDALTNFVGDEHENHTTWAGSSSITTLGTIATGTWSATAIAIDKGGTGQITQQAAIDALTDVSGATDEHVLTKDTSTGNALWKVTPKVETVSRTVNLDNTMSSAEIQAAIDEVGKTVRAGVVITFQFADGTYTLTQTIDIGGYIGGGIIKVHGNATEGASRKTTQAVILDGSSHNGFCIFVHDCPTTVHVRFLKMKSNSSGTGYSAIRAYGCGNFYMDASYIQGNGAGGGIASGIDISYSFGVAAETYVDSVQYGVSAITSITYLVNIVETGTSPVYGLRSWNAARIGKRGIMPAGSTANELAEFGGTIG